MDLYLEIDPNPNGESSEGMLYQALEPPRLVTRVMAARAGQWVPCWVTGVVPPIFSGDVAPRWVPASVQKITDSGSGVAWCLYGGRWGLRFQPVEAGPRLPLAETGPRPSGPRLPLMDAAPRPSGQPVWRLDDPAQWGEPYKIYGDPRDLNL